MAPEPRTRLFTVAGPRRYRRFDQPEMNRPEMGAEERRHRRDEHRRRIVADSRAGARLRAGRVSRLLRVLWTRRFYFDISAVRPGRCRAS